MDKGTWPNLVLMFFEQVERYGDRPFLWMKRGGTYAPLTWRDTAARVSALAHGLKTLGVAPGDRVVLVSENRPLWLVADMAIMAVGAITVPAYVTNTPEDHFHVLSDSGAKGAIVSTRRLAERLLPAAAQAAGVDFEDTWGQLQDHVRLVDELRAGSTLVAREEQQAEGIEDAERRGLFCRDKLIPAMQRAREAADSLEAVVPNDLWPLPTYSEMLFKR